MRSEFSFLDGIGFWRHCDAGLLRKLRIFQITKRLSREPTSATIIIGMRMAS